MATLKLTVLAALFLIGTATARIAPNVHLEVDDTLGFYPRPKGAPMAGEPPCPDSSAISPCVCTKYEDGSLSMNCSLVKNDEEIATAFKADFPQKDFYEFIIDHNYDVRNLMGIFNGVSFKSIVIKQTNITLVSQYAFKDSEQTLESVYFDGGLLSADTFPSNIQDYTSLTTLFVDRQQFTWLPPVTSSSLKFLTFFANQITTLEQGSFENAPMLEVINFGRNKLTKLLPNNVHLPNSRVEVYFENNLLQDVEAGAFVLPSDTSKLEIDLVLRYNQLTTVTEAAFGQIFPFVNFIQFFGNPLVCGCDMAWIVTNPSYLAKISPTDRCASGELVHDLDPTYFTDNC